MDIQCTVLELLKKGLTQTQIASELGCTQPTVSMLARGKGGKVRPSFKVVDGLKRLAKENGVDAVQVSVAESSP